MRAFSCPVHTAYQPTRNEKFYGFGRFARRSHLDRQKAWSEALETAASAKLSRGQAAQLAERLYSMLRFADRRRNAPKVRSKQ